MASGTELSEAQWERIRDFLPGRKEHVGRTAVDNRTFVNEVLWVLRSGARWSDLPEALWQVQERTQAVCALGARWRLGTDLPPTGARPEEPLSDDRLHACASTPTGGHGPQKGGDKALGRSRGGLTTKIHLLVNELGLPLDFMITPSATSQTNANVAGDDVTVENERIFRGCDVDAVRIDAKEIVEDEKIRWSGYKTVC